MTEFDPRKPVMTTDGYAVRILCTDIDNKRAPIAAAVMMDGKETLQGYRMDGQWEHSCKGSDGSMNLVNIPESKWMNLYEDPKLLADLNFYTRWSESRADADKAAFNAREVCGARRVAIVELTASGDFITTAVEK